MGSPRSCSERVAARIDRCTGFVQEKEEIEGSRNQGKGSNSGCSEEAAARRGRMHRLVQP